MAILAAGIQDDDLGGGFQTRDLRGDPVRLMRCTRSFLRFIQQRLGLRHGLDGLLHFGIGFDGHASAFIEAEAVMYISRFSCSLDPSVVLGEFGFRELERSASADSRGTRSGVVVRLPALGQLGVLLAEVLRGEVEEADLRSKVGLERD